jgi:hypothetical protein
LQKRRRREYRLARKAAFTRPEPGFSMYEGRTRGKRMRYTYEEEDDDDLSEALGTRRSTRNTGASTPADQARPTTTLSGRQVRSRVGGLYGESLLSGQTTDTRPSPATDASDEPVRASRSGRAGVSNRKMDEDGETSSEGEWDGGDEDEVDEPDEPMDDMDDEEEPSQGEQSEDEVDRSLVVTLRYGKGRSPSAQYTPAPTSAGTAASKPTSVEVVIPKPSTSAQPATITPQVTATNGYLTPTSTANGTNGSAQPTPQRSSNSLPSLPHAGPMKQSQLPFQRMPQHATKPMTPEQS